MKFTCSRDDLVNNVSIVQRAVTTNSTVNILNGILIEASDDDKIKLTGYDLQTGIEADVEASVTEKGAVVIDSKFFGDIIRKLPEPEVDIISDNNSFPTAISRQPLSADRLSLRLQDLIPSRSRRSLRSMRQVQRRSLWVRRSLRI